jgi:Lar family restriction alleviation protein
MTTNDSKDQGREAFELLPCPFCGNDKNIAMANEKHDHSGGYFIACPDCDASTGLRFACGDDPRALLIEQWNRRAATSASALARDEASVAVAPVIDVELKRIAHELRTYNPAGDEYKGANIHKVWSREIESIVEKIDAERASYQQFLDETADAELPYARRALIACIAECQALSYSEDRGITVSEAESIGGVLLELRRLQKVEADAVEVLTRASPAASSAATVSDAVPVAEVGESAVFFLRRMPDGSRWPKGTKLYAEMPATVSDAASVQKPVATLHDDGHYTFHGAKPDGFNYAGWRMDVYAAASSAAAGEHDEGAAITAAFESYEYQFRMNGEERNKYDFESGWKAARAASSATEPKP